VNAKLAKSLRATAGYRNQSATPGTMPFPGVARLYTHPVYMTHQTRKSSFAKLPMIEKVTKVFTTLTRLKHNHVEKPILEVVTDPKTGLTTPKTTLVPVSKPARLNAAEPKGVYRGLKRLARKGLIMELGRQITAAYLPKEATA
jgi:hypothetical protein